MNLDRLLVEFIYIFICFIIFLLEEKGKENIEILFLIFLFSEGCEKDLIIMCGLLVS